MKKLIILSLVIIIIAVSSLPALAKGMEFPSCNDVPEQVNKRYALAGWITQIPEGEQIVYIDVAAGNMLVKECIEGTVAVVISVVDNTTLKLSGGTPIDFEDLDVGDPVSSTGYIKYVDANKIDVVWEALQITLGANLANK
jgi:hypothetical protein